MQNSLFFVIFFLAVAPLGAALLAEDLALEEIGAPIRAWTEAHYPGGTLSYLVSCPRCVSHYTGALLTAICSWQWAALPEGLGLPAAILASLATTRLARFWLSPGE